MKKYDFISRYAVRCGAITFTHNYFRIEIPSKEVWAANYHTPGDSLKIHTDLSRLEVRVGEVGFSESSLSGYMIIVVFFRRRYLLL